MERKVSEKRAREKALQEKKKEDRLGEDSGEAIAIEEQQLSPAPSCSSSEGGTVDKASSTKEGTFIPCACFSNFRD